MTETGFVIIQLLLVLGGVLAFGFWQLYSLRRDGKRTQAPDAGQSPPAEKRDDAA